MQKIFEKKIELFLDGKQEVELDFFVPSTPKKHLKSFHRNYSMLGCLFIYEDSQDSLVGIVTGNDETSPVFKVVREDLEENLRVLPPDKEFTRQEMFDLIEQGGRLLLLEERDGAYVPYLAFDKAF
ncbi:MAG: hypothetical protein LBU27_01265 [Candidatus Peribacteria bacterium]|jgi:hypothetical protein|nr:hypothetical protein [Candidatus Peribacteria bacterium]